MPKVRFQKLVQDYKTKIQEISIDEVKAKLDRIDNFVLVDVREESEWLQARLPKAVFLSKGIIERDIEDAIPAFDTDIVLYCAGGNRSALSAYFLQEMGYTNVKSMSGGFREWLNANLPLD